MATALIVALVIAVLLMLFGALIVANVIAIDGLRFPIGISLIFGGVLLGSVALWLKARSKQDEGWLQRQSQTRPELFGCPPNDVDCVRERSNV